MEQESTPKPLTDLNELGEFGLIDQLTQDFPLRNASSLKGLLRANTRLRKQYNALLRPLPMLTQAETLCLMKSLKR